MKDRATLRFCVFCGSRAGLREEYVSNAKILGRVLATNNIELVYGGAAVGLMGALADSVLESGGRAIGVLPRGLARKEIAHPRLTKLHLVDSMHERKALMERLSDRFIALPGGFGTLEEILETITWIQLGLHRKPAGFLNVGGYYDPLLQQFERGLNDELIPSVLRQAIIAHDNPKTLVEMLLSYELPPAPVQWIHSSET